MTTRKAARHKRASSPTLKTLLEEAVTKYGTQDLAAAAIGVNSSRVNKILRADSDGESLAVTNCLKLARALGRSPSEVLKAAGKADAAELIEELYGPEREPKGLPEVTFSVELHNFEFSGLPKPYPAHVRVFMNGKEVDRG